MGNTIIVHRKIRSSVLRIENLKNFIGKNAEVTIRIENDKKKKIQSAAGFLKEYSANNLTVNEKKAWKLAIQEKHANS